MAQDAETLLTPPSIAKTAAIATHGRSWGEMGATGQTAHTLALPWINARSLNPGHSLQYHGSSGNGPFGLGWQLTLSNISRKTSKGVPKYQPADVMLADNTELHPERTTRGKIKTIKRTRGKGRTAKTYSVVRYLPRVESSFSRYELWTPVADSRGFWLVYGADGTQYCYGNSQASCIYDPANPDHIAVWLLVEIMNAVGEHIFYEYKADDKVADVRFDYQAQRYLRQVCYGNATASAELFCLTHAAPQELRWYFRALFDYGERGTDPAVRPPFKVTNENVWTLRPDPSRMHRYGFEVGTRRLCRQFLLYNHTGSEPELVHRLLLDYDTTALRYSQLKAAHQMSYDASGRVKTSPPVEYFYQGFTLNTLAQTFLPLDNMPGLNDGQRYHCVDLRGEGVPGFLCQYDKAWYYREPLRGTSGTHEIVYGPWTLLPLIPTADGSKPAVQILTDLTGDGRLDWIVAQPHGSGYYTLNPDGNWSLFKPFAQFPVEFFQQFAQLGDMTGAGLDDLAIIGPNSVRVYANLRDKGFASSTTQPHTPDRLPLFSEARSELVFFGNMHASDLSGLCRIRHDMVECWASCGHGRFTQGFKLSALPFDYNTFNVDQIRIADLDGSGAPALIRLCSDWFEIYFNYGGNALEQVPVKVAWPRGIRYDNRCQVTFADLQGIGCASLVLSVTHMQPRHFVYHFVSEQPYLLNGCNNNMGYNTTLGHVSSAQYWLDEKQQLLDAGEHPVCNLPFPQQVLAWLRQEDEITGNYRMQLWKYFEGYYDGIERQFRGFARVYQTDSELEPGIAASGHTAPTQVKNWFHSGSSINQRLNDTCQLDSEITPLGATLVSDIWRGRKRRAFDEHETAYALAGVPLSSETSQADIAQPAPLISLSEARYRVHRLNATPSSLLVQELETRSYQYESFMNDPRGEHVVHLERDQFGHLTHSISVACARRRTAADPPPFEREDQRQAWLDSHDEQQQVFYLAESRTELIHLTGATHWLLGLPWRQRSNALMLPKGTLPEGLSEQQISYESFAAHQSSDQWQALRELTSLSLQTYSQGSDGVPLYPPLAGPTEQAVFDEKALSAYDDVPDPFVIRDELVNIGYAPMPLFLPAAPDEDARLNLWSAKSGFFTYAAASDFYQVIAVQQTQSHGVTQLIHDIHRLLVLAFITPDGCRTEVTTDYHTLLPLSIKDTNDNIHEALYEPGGQPMALSFHGSEDGIQAGFKALSEYPTQLDLTPEYAIENAKEVLACAASVVRSELYSWMPMIPPGTLPLKRTDWIAKGLILPNGRIRANALRWLTGLKKRTGGENMLLKLIQTAPRAPVHSAALTADRYHDDPLQMIQMLITFVDGFGRELQSKQLVPPGQAFVSDAEGNLIVDPDGQPIEAPVDRRWRVSRRVEYNHKGETIRVYRAYFLDTWHRINDSAMREHGYHDQLFYDAAGRPVKTINALGHLAYDILHAWFTCRYDFNDADESSTTKPGKPVMAPKKTRKVSS